MTWLTGKAAKEAGYQGVYITLADGRQLWPKWVRAVSVDTGELELLLVHGGNNPNIALFKRLQPREPAIASTLKVTGLTHSRSPIPADALRIFWDGAHWLSDRGGLIAAPPPTLIVAEQEV
jgi:hypothetical protein